MQSFPNISRPKTFIKDESNEQQNDRGHQQSDFSFVNSNQPSHSFNQFSFHHNNTNSGSIDPSTISMNNGQGIMNGFPNSHANTMGYFDNASALLQDDELLAGFGDGNYGNDVDHEFSGSNFLDMSNHEQQGIPVGSNVNHMFSQTPDNAPLESPFLHGAQFRHVHQNSFSGIVGSPSSYNASPLGRSSSASMDTSAFENYMNAKTKRKSRPELGRASSQKIMASSPKTPKTPATALGGLTINTDHSTVHGQPILNHHMSQHRLDKVGSWDHDFLASSPMSSPNINNMAQISEILKTGKHASLPAKVDPGNLPTPAFAAQEAKRRRRRESHNLVERRRRDNINERIHELSDLVPLHRLEDEKVRKHLANNTPLSPGLASCSPPRATSMLAGGFGRRASSVSTVAAFAPGEEKDKAPNKGDILNGAVGWTRDLMWALLEKSKQEKILKETIEKLGGTWPFEESEEIRRMESEVQMALEKNGEATFNYSRGPGSGLRVPKFTDLSGAPLSESNSGEESRASPGIMTFKEEDEYDMDDS